MKGKKELGLKAIFKEDVIYKDILEKYEDEYNEPIKLSIISTYLSRFTEKGKMERARTGREWTYQTIKISQKHPS